MMQYHCKVLAQPYREVISTSTLTSIWDSAVPMDTFPFPPLAGRKPPRALAQATDLTEICGGMPAALAERAGNETARFELAVSLATLFDVPEERKAERDWLRAELLSCDYTPLQKSVFLGLRPLPAVLLEELKSKDLLSHIHVVGLEKK